MKLGDQLKNLRSDTGLSQEEPARKLNISRQAVYKWENDKGYPDIENLIRLSDIFNVTIDEMIRSDEELQKKINVGEEKKASGTFEDPGFYLGLILVLFGVLTDFGAFSTAVMFIGIGVMVLYEETLDLLQQVVKDFRRVRREE